MRNAMRCGVCRTHFNTRKYKALRKYNIQNNILNLNLKDNEILSAEMVKTNNSAASLLNFNNATIAKLAATNLLLIPVKTIFKTGPTNDNCQD